MTVREIKHWLREAERVRIPLRRVRGGRAVVFLGLVHRCTYRIAVDSGAPGIGSYSAELRTDVAFPNRFNAIAAGLVVMRQHWQREDVPALVDDLTEAIEELWL